MSLPDPTLEYSPADLADLAARVERLERQRIDDLRATDAEIGKLRRRVDTLEIVLDALQEEDEEPATTEACAVCNLPLSERAVLRATAPATPTDEERAAWVAHVMELASLYNARDTGANWDALHDAVTTLARGEDPRGAR